MTKKLSVPVDLSDAKRNPYAASATVRRIFVFIWFVALLLAATVAIAVGIKD